MTQHSSPIINKLNVLLPTIISICGITLVSYSIIDYYFKFRTEFAITSTLPIIGATMVIMASLIVTNRNNKKKHEIARVRASILAKVRTSKSMLLDRRELYREIGEIVSWKSFEVALEGLLSDNILKTDGKSESEESLSLVIDDSRLEIANYQTAITLSSLQGRIDQGEEIYSKIRKFVQSPGNYSFHEGQLLLREAIDFFNSNNDTND